METAQSQKKTEFIKFLPAFIRGRIEQQPKLIQILDNIGWLFFDRILRMGVGLLIGVWIARYLGPEQFGLLNFALAFTSLFGAIATLDLQGVAVRDIVREPGSAKLTLGTTAVLQLIGGLISFLLILVAIAYVRPNDDEAYSIVAVLGALMLFKGSEISVYWFESQIQSKYTVWVQNSVFALFALVKVFLIINRAPLIAFVWAIFVEATVVAFILILVMGRIGPRLSSLSVSWMRALSLLKDSWPLALSSLSIMIYMKIDQIMLGQMIGDDAVGIFSAATRISEVWYFIPMAIVASVFPAILEAKEHSNKKYLQRLQKLYDLLVIMSVSVAIPMTFLATPVVELLFGEQYQESGTVLSIHIWASVFVCLGIASGRYLLVENWQIISLQRTVAGMLLNIGVNYMLIPRYGAVGAAMATVMSQAMVALVFDSFQKKTRLMFYMKLKAINPLRLFRC